jgi:hypothetical protein
MYEFESYIFLLLCHALACPAHKGLQDTIIKHRPIIKRRCYNTNINDINHPDVSSRVLTK